MLLSEHLARAHILDSLAPLPPQALPLISALHGRAAQDIYATLALPGYDQSAMDGYALHATDLGQTDRWLRISGEQPAGPSRHLSVAPGEAVRLFTGACLPAHTAAVVMQEDTELSSDQEKIRLTLAAEPGEYIRRLGSDLATGQCLIRGGQRLTAARLAVLASQGLTDVTVHAPPRLRVLSTGSELITPGQPLPFPGALYNSNTTLLQSLIATAALPHHFTAQTVLDDLGATVQSLRTALAESDVIIFTGGVSVGAHDYVKPALLALGITPDLWRIAVKPGKPFLFAQAEGKLIFGLPGNPVSAAVTFLLFVLPALRRVSGWPRAECEPPFFTAPVGTSLEEKGDRRHYWRGLMTDGTFFPTGLQQSHALYSLSQSTTLAVVEPATCLQPGDLTSCLSLW
jgi:molybdopterin molybdotransferase